MGKNVTLSDIARRVGVTSATVQRALKGVDGVGAEKRLQIQQMAQEMGYRCNFVAASLKQGRKQLAIVLPETGGNNRYYAAYLWNGTRQYLEELAEFSVEALEFPYTRSADCQARALNEVYEQHAQELDGLLTMGTRDPAVEQAIARFHKKKIPVVLIGTDLTPADRLCYVGAYDEMAGMLAADLLLHFTGFRPYDRIILTGDLSIADQFYNAQGFEKRIWEARANVEIIKLSLGGGGIQVKDALLGAVNGKIRAFYSCSARNTVPMCEAAQELGLSETRLIGSDLFPESVALVRQGKLGAIIHKRPFEQSYEAMRVLSNRVLKEQDPTRDTILVAPVVVMQSNVDCFL